MQQDSIALASIPIKLVLAPSLLREATRCDFYYLFVSFDAGSCCLGAVFSCKTSNVPHVEISPAARICSSSRIATVTIICSSTGTAESQQKHNYWQRLQPRALFKRRDHTDLSIHPFFHTCELTQCTNDHVSQSIQLPAKSARISDLNL